MEAEKKKRFVDGNNRLNSEGESYDSSNSKISPRSKYYYTAICESYQYRTSLKFFSFQTGQRSIDGAAKLIFEMFLKQTGAYHMY